ncbi:MAG: hypothetical protein JNL48_02415 [Acidobacteria bacterium]|nr:hypothetical protein [Acidobacteriota bacterium]
MHSMSFTTAFTLVAFLSATLVAPVGAAPPDPQPAASSPVSTFRASIDQAAAQAAPLQIPTRRRGDARKQMMGGGGGGGGMMVMTLLVTAASLAGTYFLVKELKKSTDQATTAAQ